MLKGKLNLLAVFLYVQSIFCFSQYKPGDSAPSFMIQTLHGKFMYKEKALNDTRDSDPIIFCAFNKHSAFLKALWTEDGSVRRLLVRSPRNTQYVFLSQSDTALDDVRWMQHKIYAEMESLHKSKKDK